MQRLFGALHLCPGVEPLPNTQQATAPNDSEKLTQPMDLAAASSPSMPSSLPSLPSVQDLSLIECLPSSIVSHIAHYLVLGDKLLHLSHLSRAFPQPSATWFSMDTLGNDDDGDVFPGRWARWTLGKSVRALAAIASTERRCQLLSRVRSMRVRSRGIGQHRVITQSLSRPVFVALEHLRWWLDYSEPQPQRRPIRIDRVPFTGDQHSTAATLPALRTLGLFAERWMRIFNLPGT